jgi:Rieske Fe-S protein
MDPIETDTPVTRRTLLAAGSGGALALTLLAACGGGNGSSSSATSAPGSAGSSAGGGSGGGSGGSQALAKLSDVPVGGAVSATDAAGKPVIVAQPRAGKVVAFSAICTHMGCTVAPQGKILQCPCHGSTYDLATGDNTGGPAPRPLTELSVKVQGGSVVES